MGATNEHRNSMFSLIESWQQSGLSQKIFCEQQQIAIHQFYYWYKYFRTKSDGPIVMEKNLSILILIPFEVDEFWAQIRGIIREEFFRNQKEQPISTSLIETPGLTEKPLYKIQEICALFKISKPTIYDWIKHGKLKRVK